MRKKMVNIPVYIAYTAFHNLDHNQKRSFLSHENLAEKIELLEQQTAPNINPMRQRKRDTVSSFFLYKTKNMQSQNESCTSTSRLHMWRTKLALESIIQVYFSN